MKALRTFFRSFLLDANLNPANMQGTGFYYILKNFAKDNGMEVSDKELREHLSYFNTNASFVNIMIGIWGHSYHGVEGKSFGLYKKVYSSALAALGDSFFGHALKPFVFVCALLGGFIHPIFGITLYLVMFNIPHFVALYGGTYLGYHMGGNIVDFFRKIRFNFWSECLDNITAFVLGIVLVVVIRSDLLSSANDLIVGVVVFLIGVITAFKFRIFNAFSMFLILLLVVSFIRLAYV